MQPEEPRIYNVLRGDATATRTTSYGSVGQVFSGEGIEAVWVSKQGEEVDPNWFSQKTVDLILVVKGQLRVEFENSRFLPRTLDAGALLVLPPETRCRAYRWPRDRIEATVFVAVYPSAAEASQH